MTASVSGSIVADHFLEFSVLVDTVVGGLLVELGRIAAQLGILKVPDIVDQQGPPKHLEEHRETQLLTGLHLAVEDELGVGAEYS